MICYCFTLLHNKYNRYFYSQYCMKPKQKSYSPSPPQFRRNTSTRKPINPVRCPPILD
jgi:hypothetical protein